MYYSDELIEEVRTRNPIVDVIGSYVKLKKSDCLMYQSGQILSAYIFDEQDYQITNGEGKLLETMKGKDLRGSYEDKTKTLSPEKAREH